MVRASDNRNPYDGDDGQQSTDDPRAVVDPKISDAGREGLTGTTPATVYKSPADTDQISIPPDGRPVDEQPQWRQDFPIDVPQDNYVARRDFMKFLVLTSLAFTVGQATIGVASLLRRNTPNPQPKRITLLSQLPVGATIAFTYPADNDPCILTRLDDTTLLAYSQKCTHLSCAVIPEPAKGVIHCPCHEGYFDLKTGRPIAGPPRRPLPKITLEIRGDEIYATGMERRTV